MNYRLSPEGAKELLQENIDEICAFESSCLFTIIAFLLNDTDRIFQIYYEFNKID